jgi:WD40 repeat protein
VRLGRSAIAAFVVAVALSSAATATATTVYLPSYGELEPEGINAYGVGAEGSLAPLAGSPFAIGPPGPSPEPSGLAAVAFTPDGSRGVAPFNFKGGVIGITIAANGSISPVPGPTLTSPASSVAVSPDGRFAYVTTREFPPGVGEGGITGLSIEPDGSLSTLSSSPFGDPDDDYEDVAITPDGRFLFATGGGRIHRFAVGASGALTELTPSLEFGLNSLTASPDGQFLFGTDTSSSPSQLMSLTIGADGSLTENGPPTELGGTGVGFISVGPDGKHVYAPVEGADAVQVISVGADGRLTVTSSAPAENPGTSAVSPNGRFLLHGFDDGSTGLVGSMSIGPGGDLTPLGSTVLWKSGEPTRPQFLPQPAPVASFLIKRGAPGGISRFSAVGSARVTQFDWDFGDGTVEKNGAPLTTHIYRSAGVYWATLTVADAQGCSTQQIYTGQSTTCPGGASATMTGIVDTLPTITKFAIKPRKFVPGTKRKRGTRFRYTLTEKAKVRFTILRRRKGKHDGRRFVKVGVVAASGKSGKNRTRFTGILNGKSLRPGTYRTVAVATDSLGGDSASVVARFKVR